MAAGAHVLHVGCVSGWLIPVGRCTGMGSQGVLLTWRSRPGRPATRPSCQAHCCRMSQSSTPPPPSLSPGRGATPAVPGLEGGTCQGGRRATTHHRSPHSLTSCCRAPCCCCCWLAITDRGGQGDRWLVAVAGGHRGLSTHNQAVVPAGW